jgi:MFS family permease
VDGIGAHLHPGRHPAVNIANRRGRKNAMVYALVLMGISTLLIGLTPTYDSISVIAPGLLIVFRLM